MKHVHAPQDERANSLFQRLTLRQCRKVKSYVGKEHDAERMAEYLAVTLLWDIDEAWEVARWLVRSNPFATSPTKAIRDLRASVRELCKCLKSPDTYGGVTTDDALLNASEVLERTDTLLKKPQRRLQFL